MQKSVSLFFTAWEEMQFQWIYDPVKHQFSLMPTNQSGDWKLCFLFEDCLLYVKKNENAKYQSS